jgi:hypothetical protein
VTIVDLRLCRSSSISSRSCRCGLVMAANRRHTTVQQHCKRGSIKAVMDGRSWKVPPAEALRYLLSVKSEPFFSHYSMERYKSMLNDFLTSGLGKGLRTSDKEILLIGSAS